MKAGNGGPRRTSEGLPIMPTLCSRCRRSNPQDARFCHFDGNPLDGQGRTAPTAGPAPFLVPLVFPSGQTCGTFGELAVACMESWEEARGLLRDGHFQHFLASLGRHDLAQAALRGARFPDADRGLDQFLGSLPGTTLPAPQLKVQAPELNLGVLRPGENSQVALRLASTGGRLLYGSVVCPDAPWLALGSPDGGRELLFKFSREHTVPVFVCGERLRAASRLQQGTLLVDSNGGGVTVTVRVEVPVTPFPVGPLAGATSPRQLADKARAHPQEAAAEFVKGTVAEWYRANGWTYPMRGTTPSGLAAVQQFFEALGLTAVPRLAIKPSHLDVLATPGKTVHARLWVATEDKRPVYAHGHSNQPWLHVGQAVPKGCSAEVPLTIEVPLGSGQELTAEVTVTGNGNQQFRVPVKVVTPAAAAPRPRPLAVAPLLIPEILPLEEDGRPSSRTAPLPFLEAETPRGQNPSRGWMIGGALLLLFLLLGGGLTAWMLSASRTPDGEPVAQKPPSQDAKSNTASDSGPARPKDGPGDRLTDKPEKTEKTEKPKQTPVPEEDKPSANLALGDLGKLDFKRLDYFKDNPKRELPAALPDFVTSAVWEGHTNHVRGVAFGYRDAYVVSVSGDVSFVQDPVVGKRKRRPTDFTIRVWDPRSGKQLHKVDGFKEPLDGVSLAPGGRLAAFGYSGAYDDDGRWQNSKDHRMRLWDIETKKEIPADVTLQDYLTGKKSASTEPRFIGLDSSVFSSDFSPDGSLLAGAANNGTVVVWDTRTGKKLTQVQVQCERPVGGVRGVSEVRFTPEGTHLLTCNGDFTLSVMDTTTLGEQKRLISHRDTVWTVAAYQTKGGKLLALSGSGRWQGTGGFFESPHKDYAIRLWDITDPAQGREVRRFNGHADSVQALAFCPNGRHFISGCFDGTVVLWDLESGKQLRLLGKHTGRGKAQIVRSVAVSHDGRSVVSGGDDDLVRFWRLPATVKDLLAAVKAGRIEAVRAAVKDIDTMGPEDCRDFPKLFAALEHVKDAATRTLVFRALNALAKRSSELPVEEMFKQLPVKGLVALLRSAEEEEQYLAVRCLCALPKEDAREAIKPLCAFVGREPALRAALKGIEALQRFGEKRPEIGAALEKAMQHPEEPVRLAAARVLAGFGPEWVKLPRFLALLSGRDSSEELQEVAEKALQKKLTSLTGDDVPRVRETLRSGRPRAVLWAIDAAAALGEQAKEAVPELCAVLKKNADVEVRVRCIRALRAMSKHAAAAVEEFVQIIEEGTENRLVVEAVQALRAVDPTNEALAKGIPSLVRDLLPRTDKEARKALANALSNPSMKVLLGMREPALVGALFKELSSWDPGAYDTNSRRRPKPENLSPCPTVARCQVYRVICELADKAPPGSGLAQALTTDDNVKLLHRTYWARENALKFHKGVGHSETYEEVNKAFQAVKRLKEKMMK